MRLIHTGLKTGTAFFWDEKVNSQQTRVTQPIKDHIEIGFSGEQEAPTFDDLLIKLSQIDDSQVLFNHVYCGV